jgi:hypothetical protein
MLLETRQSRLKTSVTHTIANGVMADATHFSHPISACFSFSREHVTNSVLNIYASSIRCSLSISLFRHSQTLVNYWLLQHGFTVHIGDCVPTLYEVLHLLFTLHAINPLTHGNRPMCRTMLCFLAGIHSLKTPHLWFLVFFPFSFFDLIACSHTNWSSYVQERARTLISEAKTEVQRIIGIARAGGKIDNEDFRLPGQSFIESFEFRVKKPLNQVRFAF